MVITDEVYEYLAHVAAYKDYDEEDVISCRGADGVVYRFEVDEVFDPFFNGFEAYGLIQLDASGNRSSNAVLVCQGTDSLSDVLSDLSAGGVGFGQFTYNLDDVEEWCEKMALKRGRTVNATGHSLGGSLAQMFVAYCSDDLGVAFGDIVTFNSPGICRKVSDFWDDYDFTRGIYHSARHYVSDGDIISLAGRHFLDGEVLLYGTDRQCGEPGDDGVDVLDYLNHQHTGTRFFSSNRGSIGGEDGVLIQVMDSAVASYGSFSYLSVNDKACDLTGTRLASIECAPGHDYVFNSEYAEAILALTHYDWEDELDLDAANIMLSRDDVEEARLGDFFDTFLPDVILYDNDVNINLTPVMGFVRGTDDCVWLDAGSHFDDLLFDFKSCSFSEFHYSVKSVSQLSWRASGASSLRLADAGGTQLSITVSGNALDVYNLPDGAYAWQALNSRGEILQGDLALNRTVHGSAVYQAVRNNVKDVFFASVDGVWNDRYLARHNGAVDAYGNMIWDGTGNIAIIDGRNRITSVFNGSTDANLLLLTDDPNGDAIFLDDLQSQFPSGVDGVARVSQLKEISAGGGDDVIDFTSGVFAYDGGNVVFRGGDGNDVIWSGTGCNWLFGDAGDDWLIGGAGDDVIVGGSGDDTLHGGGGADVFCFGGDWGQDTVEQLAGSSVTLWFAEGSYSGWDAECHVYRDGVNTVTVACGADFDIHLRFGGKEDMPRYQTLAAAGAFAAGTSGLIFT